ncbi:acyl-CoA dehydrogenase-related protein [Dorcoceras hygrometricum]|uniref:Acyl-CoA dehydrogenase-related protein n=1 Tax=Dorcoceras hygrometricum TaxID=472368 RepID=A0A2Z7D934_9LAMI|nr:acyl-CoA dehydrogenase-related protein [Dorcoceras hygrometricum]
MFLVDWAVKMRIRPPEFETSICDAKYHVSLIDSDLVIYRTALVRTFQVSTRSVLGKCVYLFTLAMSLFDLQDVRIAIGSLATLDLPMVVDLIGIYGLKGPYCTLTTTNWFSQALSVIPRGSWGDVARRFTMIRWAIDRSDLIGDRSYDEVAAMDIVIWTRARWAGPSPSLILFNIELRLDFNIVNTLNLTLNLALAAALPPLYNPPPPPSCAAAVVRRRRRAPPPSLRRKIVSGQFVEENPSVQISSRLLVQGDEGVSYPVVDRIGVIYRNLP